VMSSALELVTTHIAKNTKAFYLALGIGVIWGLYIYRKSRNLWQLMGFTSIAPVKPAYDYIIVGGGTAGCLLANRLAENRNCSVLLFDVGNAILEDYTVQSPLLWTIQWYSPVDWGYKSTKQSTLNDREIELHRSKLLGGNGTNDPLIYLRGDPSDYDQWKNDFGVNGWNFKDLLPLFQKSEQFADAKSTSQQRGTSGELRVETHKSLSNIARAFLVGGVRLGISYIAGDYHESNSLSGAWPCQLTIAGNIRQFGANAFLRPAFLKRPNLTVRTESLVTKILFENSTAIGVQWSGSGMSDANQVVRAKKEVILAGGPIESARLLMLSGVGPKNHLEEMEIDVVADLPVGEHYQDQLIVPVNYKVKNPDDSVDHFLAKSMDVLRELFLRYIYFHTGRFAQPVIEAFSFEPKTEGETVPSLQYLCSTRNFVNCASVDPEVGGEGFSILSVLLHPKSTGFMRLRSKSPNDKPIIEPNYLSEEDDRHSLIVGAKRATEILQDDSFEPVKGDPILDAEFKERFESQRDDAFWSEYIKSQAVSGNNPIGACRMGSNPENSVVNERLQVHGLQRLRVVDASVIPRHVSSCCPRATTMVIAEKAAVLIKEDYSL